MHGWKASWYMAQGVSTRNCTQAFDWIAGQTSHPTLISRVTNALSTQVGGMASRNARTIIDNLSRFVLVCENRQDKCYQIKPSSCAWLCRRSAETHIFLFLSRGKLFHFDNYRSWIWARRSSRKSGNSNSSRQQVRASGLILLFCQRASARQQIFFHAQKASWLKRQQP